MSRITPRLAALLTAITMLAVGCGGGNVELSEEDVAAMSEALLPLQRELREQTQDVSQSFNHVYDKRQAALVVFTGNDRVMVCERITEVLGSMPDPVNQVEVQFLSDTTAEATVLVTGRAGESCKEE